MNRVLIAFLFSILNHIWHLGDKVPSCCGINNVIPLLLIHYRCLSVLTLLQDSSDAWERERSLDESYVWLNFFQRAISGETCSKRSNGKSLEDIMAIG